MELTQLERHHAWLDVQFHHALRSSNPLGTLEVAAMMYWANGCYSGKLQADTHETMQLSLCPQGLLTESDINKTTTISLREAASPL